MAKDTSAPVKLHAAGLHALTIGDTLYRADKDGMIEVAHHHADLAVSHGARREASAPAVPAADRIGALEARVAALEARFGGKKPG